MNVPITDLYAQYEELRDEIDAAIARILRTSQFIGGDEVRGFDAEFAAYCGSRFAIGVGNGTDALRLALQACGVGAGDAVLTVPFTFIATVEAIVHVGAQAVFVDVADDDFNIDVAAVEHFLRSETEPRDGRLIVKRSGATLKALMPVHLYGLPAQMAPLLQLARHHGLRIIEDAAQAVGARCWIDGVARRVGSIGDVAGFSLYPGKNLGAMGDAGVVTTSDPEIARRIRLLADHGQSEKYVHVLPDGGNSRLDALQAAVLRIKLRRLDDWNAARRRWARRYDERLAGLPLRVPRESEGSESVYHQYAIRVAERDRVRRALAERGIASGIHYPLPVHRQRGFAALGLGEGSFPVAERCAREVLSLPLWPQMTDAHIDAVVAALSDALRG
ncbi:MAG TPA: DegT/DnrJ/EryC1/StrS family aminotransferase [Candidatus Kryptonia bacterium]|nr:DegT/DnrJ/EryC1/StrS family aminotransferase [Candidatus Kryptonia bacterium]